MTRLIPLALATAFLAASATAFLAAPAAAQDAEDRSLFEEGADLLLRGLIEEVAPPLQELAGIGQEVIPILRSLGEEFGPALSDVAGQIDSITYYEPPKILPNGDIVMRRSADAPAWVPPLPQDDEDEPRVAPDEDEPDQDDPPASDLSPPPEAEPDLRLDPTLRLDPDGGLEL